MWEDELKLSEDINLEEFEYQELGVEHDLGARVDRLYFMFQNMHTRVSDNSSYSKVSICGNWYNFEKFKSDIIEIPNHDRPSWELDKDLLSPKGFKMYSKDTCCFLPREINRAMIKQKFVEKYRRLPYTKWCPYKKKWFSTVKLTKDDGIRYFNSEFDAFLCSREVKNAHMICLVKDYSNYLPESICDSLRSFYISFDH